MPQSSAKSAAAKRSSGNWRSFMPTTSQEASPGLQVEVTAIPVQVETVIPADIDWEAYTPKKQRPAGALIPFIIGWLDTKLIIL
jgi:hypothetical protein